jgi:hypothetical protein
VPDIEGLKAVTDAAAESAKFQRETSRNKMRPVTAKHGVAVGQDLVKELQDGIEKFRSVTSAKKAK